MVMAVEPVHLALQSLRKKGRQLLLSARGRPVRQDTVRDWSREETLTLVCGRYEEVDARLLELENIEPVCIGDFVLSGGESAALALMEAVARLRPGFMGREESAEEESFHLGLLEYPHYTRPQEYQGLSVPQVLLSGDHGRVAQWRKGQSLLTTLRYRPDLLQRCDLDPADYAWLRGFSRTLLGRNLYPALLHSSVLNKEGQSGSVSLTNLDIHDIARVCATYALPRYYLVTPLRDQQELAKRLIRHWTEDGYTAKSALGPENPCPEEKESSQARGEEPETGRVKRAQALERVRILTSLEQVVEDIRCRTGLMPFIAATSARDEGSASEVGLRQVLQERPVLLLLGTGHGLAPEVIRQADTVLRPIRPFDSYRHLSVRTAAAILIDRILGDTW